MSAVLATFDARLKRLASGDRWLRRNPLFYGAVAQSIEALARAPLSERIAFTEQRLQQVLRAARRTSYGAGVSAADSIESWPLLQKSNVRDTPEQFHTRNTWFAARASTGGTTGTPLRLMRSLHSIVAEQVCIDRMIASLGVDPKTMRMAVLRGDNIKPTTDTSPPYWSFTHGGRRLTFSANHLNGDTVAHYRSALEAFEPDVLWVYPSALESFCRLLADAHRRVNVPRVLSSSEMLPPNVWRLAQERLGCQLLDYYGQAERVAFAYARRAREYYFLPGYAYVELLPRGTDGRMQEVEIVGTSLWNLTMPLVRYRTGDLIRVPAEYSSIELNEIAYGLRPFDGVIGRASDVLLAPDGASFLIAINHIPRGVDHLVRLQVVQQSLDHIVLRALVESGFGDRQIEQLVSNARAKVPAEVRIDVEIVDALERTANGKTPFILRSPQVQTRFDALRGRELDGCNR
jgi:phenylacetate-CoA ligase